MRHYHTLTQAHINHAYRIIIHRCRLRKVQCTGKHLDLAVIFWLRSMGFNPRQVRRANDV